MSRVASAAFLFLISGFAALVYQVIWQRILGVFSGVHIYSITMIVTAFMAGLGVGSLVGGKFADRLPRSRAVLGFGVCEVGIGLFALVSTWLYYDVAYLKLGFLVRYKLAVPLVHFTLLLLPTFLMGASLPLLSRGLVRDTARAARTIGLLYGLNTLGAALGAFTAIWWMIGAFGFVGTTRVAALLNLLAAVGAWWIARDLEREERDGTGDEPVVASETSAASGTEPDLRLGVGGWATLYWLSGFIALSLEILWFRILDVSIKQGPYTFGHLLGVFLVFLGLGGIAGALAVERARRPGRVFLWGQWSITVSAGIALALLLHLPSSGWPLGGLFTFWHSDTGIEFDKLLRAIGGTLEGESPSTLILRTVQVYGLVPLALIAVPTFLMGWTYAFVQRAVQTDPSQVGWRVGLIQTANIVGSILGSLVTGALLLSALGTPATLRLLFVLGTVFGGLAAVKTLGRRRWLGLTGVLVVSLGLAAAIPAEERFWARFHGSTADEVIVAEDASSIVVLQHAAENYAVMRVNGAGHSVLPYGGPHTLLGTLPGLVHPDPRNVLLIGLGLGNTPWAAGAVPGIEEIEVYEIAKPEYDVLEMHQERWFATPEARQLHGDPRLVLRFSDGRLAMRLTDKQYDLIEIDALEPYMAYSGNLYSREFFELGRDSLAPGGLFCSYTPTERTRRTMISAFPYVLSLNVPGYLHFMLGSNRPIEFDREVVLERLSDPRVQQWFGESAQESTRTIGQFVVAAQVVAIGPDNRRQFLEGEINTDLFPRDEFDKTIGLEGN